MTQLYSLQHGKNVGCLIRPTSNAVGVGAPTKVTDEKPVKSVNNFFFFSSFFFFFFVEFPFYFSVHLVLHQRNNIFRRFRTDHYVPQPLRLAGLELSRLPTWSCCCCWKRGKRQKETSYADKEKRTEETCSNGSWQSSWPPHSVGAKHHQISAACVSLLTCFFFITFLLCSFLFFSFFFLL